MPPTAPAPDFTVNEPDDSSGFISAWDLMQSMGGSGRSRKPKASAAPLEKQDNISKPSSKYLCPRCKEGHLRRIKGRNGWFWSCSSYPHCTATYDDINGLPNI